jgi:Retinoic acid induced 16-like protein/Family of unknown function (DUF5917)
MRTLITGILDVLFSSVQKSLLPNMSVHSAVRQFINVCIQKGDLSAPASKPAFANLLRTLCTKLRSDPSLVWVFFEEKTSTGKPQFTIFSTLLQLLNDEDDLARVAVEGVLCCLQLPDQRISHFAIDHTDMIDMLLVRLHELFDRLPTTIESSKEDIPKRSKVFRDFFARLSLIDTVVQSTFPFFGERFAKEFDRQFLQGAIAPRLLAMEESVARWTTIYLRHILQHVESPLLHTTIAKFIIGDRAIGAETAAEEKEHQIRAAVIKRMDSLNQNLACATLGLFDSLLATKLQFVYENLLLRNLRGGRHLASDEATHMQQVKIAQVYNAADILAMFGGLEHVVTDRSYQHYLIDAQEEAKSWLEMYDRWDDVPHFVDAIRQRREAKRQGVRGNSATVGPIVEEKDDAVEEEEQSQSQDQSDEQQEFYEGLFLATLFRRLESVVENSFEVNLRVTSILSKLCHCPHPMLHSFTLSPSLKVQSDVRTLLFVLSCVWKDTNAKCAEMPNFRQRLAEVRKRLDEGESIQFEAADTTKKLEAVLLLEEFFKEVLAIAQAKGNLQALVMSIFESAPAQKRQLQSVSLIES